MTPDHEAAKKLAHALIETGCQGNAHANLVACYLDALARLAEWEATARKLTNGLCSDREELEGFIEEMVDILKGELAPLEARLDEAEKLRDVAYGLLDVAVKERDEAREELAIFKRRRISETYLDGIEAQRDEALALLEEICKWERGFDDPDARAMCRKIDAFLAKHRKIGANDGK